MICRTSGVVLLALLGSLGGCQASHSPGELQTKAAALGDAPPVSVGLTAPVDMTYVKGSVAISATASASAGIDHVEFWIDTTQIGSATTAPYSVVWNTTAIAPMPPTHTVKAVAVDALGQTGVASVQVTVDNAPPSFASLFANLPPNQPYAMNVIGLGMTGLDNVGLDHYELYDGTTLITSGPVPGTGWTYTWLLFSVPSGAHTLKVRVFDHVGLSTDSAPLTLLVSKTNPSVVITGPAEGATVSGVVQIMAAEIDDFGVDHTDYFDNGVRFATAPGSFAIASWNTNSLTAGAHTLTATMVDTNGKSFSSPPVHVTVNNAPPMPPVVVITTPAAGALLNGVVPVAVMASAAGGLARVELSVDGTLQTQLVPPALSFNWDTSAVASGSHTLSARAVDNQGAATVSAPVQVQVDHTPPILAVTWSPSETTIFTGTVQISATANDDNGIASVTFLDGVAVLASATTAAYAFSWDTTVATDGAHTITVKAQDNAGNVTSTPFTVHVNNGTTVTVAGTGPGGVAGKAVFLHTVTRDDSAVASVVYQVDGVPLAAPPATAAPFEAPWSPASSGAHRIFALVTDGAGVVAQSPDLVVTADIAGPTVTLTAPAAGSTATGTVALGATASDPSGIAKVDFYDGVLFIGSATTAPYAQSWDASKAAPGGHTLLARAYDLLGNTTDATVMVTVPTPPKPDTTPPKVSITAPIQNAIASTSVVWSVSSSDNIGVTRVDLYDNATLVKSFTAPSFVFSWNTSAVSAGLHKLTARAFDAAGNSATSAAILVVIDHTPPLVSVTAPANHDKVKNHTTVTVTALAIDLLGVAKVEFYVGGALTCTDSKAPYSCAWAVPNGASKSYALQAKAYDVAGNSASSAVVNVTTR